MGQRYKKDGNNSAADRAAPPPMELTPNTAEKLRRLAAHVAASPRPAMRRLIDLERRARFARCGFDAPP